MQWFQMFRNGFTCGGGLLQTGGRLQGSCKALDMQRRETRRTLWDRNTSGFSIWDGREGFRGLRNKAGGTRWGRGREKKKGCERYLLSPLSPCQPHRFLRPAFVSWMGSLAYLQIWRQFGSFNTSGMLRKAPAIERRQTNRSRWGCQESSARGQIHAQTRVQTSPLP